MALIKSVYKGELGLAHVYEIALGVSYQTEKGIFYCRHNFNGDSRWPCSLPECHKEFKAYEADMTGKGIDVDWQAQNKAPKVEIRQFETGATRDSDQGKFDYEAFFSPLVFEARAQFMHKNRFQKDGEVRDGDNWQRGMDRSVYMKSLMRHVVDVWKEHRGIKTKDGLVTAICAAMFNLEGMLYEILKESNQREGRKLESESKT